MPLLFWFDLFLYARAEILEKILLVLWEIWRRQKDILKSTDLYEPWICQNGSLSWPTFLFWNFVCKICNTQNQISLKRTAVVPNGQCPSCYYLVHYAAITLLKSYLNFYEISERFLIFNRFESISSNHRCMNKDWSASWKI